MTIKIKYRTITNPSPIREGWMIYVDGKPAYDGDTLFVSIEAVKEWYHNWLVVEGFWSQRHDIIGILKGQRGQYFFQRLQEFPTQPYYVQTWSRDCDMYESTRVTRVDSYIDLIKNYGSYLRGLEGAEGPSSWQLIEPTEEGSWNYDRALAAYENGNPYHC